MGLDRWKCSHIFEQDLTMERGKPKRAIYVFFKNEWLGQPFEIDTYILITTEIFWYGMAPLILRRRNFKSKAGP